MKALVTGGAGFIGSALARSLVARGDDVRVLDSFLVGPRDGVPEGCELTEVDLRDLDGVSRACKGVDVIFHIGAVRSVERSVEDPVLSTECNIIGTLNVLIGAEAAGVRRVVYASSSSVYGDRGEVVFQEDMPPQPMSPYAVSKLAGEYYCSTWTKLDRLSTISLRYFNVFGPGMRATSKYALVFANFASALLEGRAPELHWDGEQAKDFTYIDDVVRANLLAAESGADGVVNIGGGDPKTINKVLRDVSDAVGVWIEPTRTGQRAGDVRRTHADITRARDLLGWQPEAEWHEAVAATVEWFRR